MRRPAAALLLPLLASAARRLELLPGTSRTAPAEARAPQPRNAWEVQQDLSHSTQQLRNLRLADSPSMGRWDPRTVMAVAGPSLLARGVLEDIMELLRAFVVDEAGEAAERASMLGEWRREVFDWGSDVDSWDFFIRDGVGQDLECRIRTWFIGGHSVVDDLSLAPYYTSTYFAGFEARGRASWQPEGKRLANYTFKVDSDALRVGVLSGGNSYSRVLYAKRRKAAPPFR
mmetsp:Transcript_95494/g.275726  ORF Transcript_95494/g.275726 Transcript_95494/m.275726 type:complete len:230 (-) Transcript_95494:68-757(-)